MPQSWRENTPFSTVWRVTTYSAQAVTWPVTVQFPIIVDSLVVIHYFNFLWRLLRHILSRLEVEVWSREQRSADSMMSISLGHSLNHGCCRISSRVRRSLGRMARHLRTKSLHSTNTENRKNTLATVIFHILKSSRWTNNFGKNIFFCIILSAWLQINFEKVILFTRLEKSGLYTFHTC